MRRQGKSRTRVQPQPAPAPAPITAAGTASAVQEGMTLTNLQIAYNGESNANLRYLLFAKRADEEGYGPIASLFRAAARAEDIHAASHAAAIRNLGGEPSASVDPVVTNSTKENLETALKGEIYERDSMYPKFFQQARGEGRLLAVRTFELAQKAEAEHATLFAEALQSLEGRRGGVVEYFVCPVCGFTTPKKEGERCPVCSGVTDRFEKIS